MRKRSRTQGCNSILSVPASGVPRLAPDGVAACLLRRDSWLSESALSVAWRSVALMSAALLIAVGAIPNVLAADRIETEQAAREAARGSEPRGSLVIIGGAARHDNSAIWNEVVRLAGGTGKRIAVFPCASGYPLKNGERAVKLLRKHGADAFLVPLAPTGFAGTEHEGVDARQVARDPRWVELVRGADGVYFIGGNQMRIRDALVDADGANTPMLDAIWEVYRRGGVVSGTSAGAAVMSRVMFRDAGVVLNTLLHGVRMGKELDHGLGFLDGQWLVDQHCLARGRFARALVAMRTQNLPYGLGIDEDTAVVVEQGEVARVIGNRGAVVLDLSRAEADEKASTFNLNKARLTYLNHGDSIHLRTLAVTPNPAKVVDRKIDPNAADFQPSLSRRLFYLDVLANTTLVDVMSRVIDHRDGQAIGLAFDGVAAAEGDTPGFEFRFYRGADSLGWETDQQGAVDCTVQNIYLDVRPVTIRGPLYSPHEPSESLRGEKASGVVAGATATK